MLKIENFNKLSWIFRLSLFILVGAAALAVFWYFVTSSTRDETELITQQAVEINRQNIQAQIAAQRINEFRAAYQGKQQEYEELKSLLPEQREVTAVLAGVQERARSSGLSLRRFVPRDDVQQDYYSGKPVEVEVAGTFPRLRSFFEQMAHYQRIVSITDFSISAAERSQVNATVSGIFKLTAYFVSAEKLEQSKQSQQPPPVNSVPPAPVVSPH